MDLDVLRVLLQRHRDLVQFLRERDELSLALSAEDDFKRAFVVACGCYCERRLSEVIIASAARTGDTRLVAYVKGSLARRYHELFDWKVANANRFWAAFGDAFKTETLALLKQDTRLDDCVRRFVELGGFRNAVAHTFSDVPKTVDELEQLLNAACAFLEFVESRLSGDVQEPA